MAHIVEMPDDNLFDFFSFSETKTAPDSAGIRKKMDTTGKNDGKPALSQQKKENHTLPPKAENRKSGIVSGAGSPDMPGINADTTETAITFKLDNVLENAKETLSQNMDIYREVPSISQKETAAHRKKERQLQKNFKGLLLYPLLTDTGVKKILIPKYNAVYAEKGDIKEKCSVCFENEEALKQELDVLYAENAGICYETTCYREFLIPGGIRVAQTTPPLSAGVMASVILPDPALVKSRDFIRQNIIGKEMLYFLERCVRAKISILVTGNDREACMELLNLLNGFIPETESVIAIDSRYELEILHNNMYRLNPGMADDPVTDVFYIAEQLKADRITLNELTGGTVTGFLESSSMNGKSHTASMYANSSRNACNQRIPFLYRMQNNLSKTPEYLPSLIAESLQLIVHVTKNAKGQERVVNISHADGLNTEGNVNLKEIFLYNRQRDDFEQPGYIPKKLIKIIEDQDIVFDADIFRKKEKQQ